MTSAHPSSPLFVDSDLARAQQAVATNSAEPALPAILNEKIERAAAYANAARRRDTTGV